VSANIAEPPAKALLFPLCTLPTQPVRALMTAIYSQDFNAPYLPGNAFFPGFGCLFMPSRGVPVMELQPHHPARQPRSRFRFAMGG
jgi:hypothetical protein